MNDQIQRSLGVTEISGRPGQVWGNTVIPAGGKASLKIVGDTLHGTTVINFGLETKEIYTRIQNIDSIEVVEGRIWWLLILGITTVFWIIGILFIVLFFLLKQKWITVSSGSARLVIFHQNVEQAKQFSQTLLALARQLNTPSVPRQNSNQTARQPQNSHRPASTGG